MVGAAVQLGRAGHLLDAPLLHHHDPVGQGHGLGLVVGHIDHGCAQLLVQCRQLHPHVGPQLCIQIGQRFVHQKGPGLAHDGAADGHPLLLPAGQLARAPVQQMLDVQHFGGFVHPPGNLLLRHLAHRQGKRHIVIYTHLRIQGIVLEHHGKVPLTGFGIVAQLIANPQLAFGDFLQTGNHAQGGGFAAAGGTHEHDEFPIPDVQREIIHCTLALIVNFADILQNDLCHIAFLFPLVCTGSPSLLPGRTARYTGYDTGFFFPFPPLSGKSFVKAGKANSSRNPQKSSQVSPAKHGKSKPPAEPVA